MSRGPLTGGTGSGTQTVAGTVTANQGTANGGGANAWPVLTTSASAITATQTNSANLKAQADQGVAASLASAWPIKVTDGSNLALVSGGALQVALSTSPTVNQGTQGSPGAAWWTLISDGLVNAQLATPTGTGGVALLTASGTKGVLTSLNGVSTGVGTTVDLGAARAHISLVITPSASLTGGAVALEVSHDGTNWANVADTGALSGTAAKTVSTVGAYRYARANITTTITGGNVTVTVAGA